MKTIEIYNVRFGIALIVVLLIAWYLLIHQYLTII